MQQEYKYVRVYAVGRLRPELKGLRDELDSNRKRGYICVGWFPAKYDLIGRIKAIDLVFAEKDRKGQEAPAESANATGVCRAFGAANIPTSSTASGFGGGTQGDGDVEAWGEEEMDMEPVPEVTVEEGHELPRDF